MRVELPAGWVASSLESVARSTGGATPPKEESKFWVRGVIPWVSPKDMKTFVIERSEDLVTEAALDRLSIVPERSVLTVVRSGILSRTFPVAVNRLPVTINQDMRAFTPMSGVCPSFLAWQLIARQHEILSACSKQGTTVASIEGPALSRFPLWFAPEAEQTRIVAKLEELLSDLDASVAELEAAKAKLAQYRRSLLKAAVEGALTADWRREHGGEGESGEALLQRVLAERRARWEGRQRAKFEQQGKAPPKGWQSAYPEPVAPDTRALPALPQGWVWTTVGQCFDVAVGATPSRKEPRYWNGNVAWVSSGEVQFTRITTTKERISSEGLANSSTRINPPGSVMLGMIGEGKTRGQVAILDIEAANNQNCAAIWVSETDVPSEYVYYWLWSRYDETRRGSTGNNQPALNKSIIERMTLPLPPLAEMKLIVRAMEQRFDLHGELQAAMAKSLAQCTAQRQNLLRAAFSGRLVPQDPNDEPASLLLERIRAARSAQSPPGKPRGRPRRVAA